ncbi:kelch-like protein 3 [Hemicordylus capensis]|uniref:kelch-like protein 3 n=1 Tax=Hemicordylus capensis TaxID=884348 RepID=UPI00230294A3|nr:kelch-like protein 3 [Hemicordylus capensis]
MSTSQRKGALATFKPRPLGLKEGLAGMYHEELLCDATLVVDGQRFRCHRALLAAVSPYFRDLFTKTCKESSGGEVLLQDVTPSVVRSILKYIYTEELSLTPEQGASLFAGASRLQVIPLQDVCSRYLVSNLSIQNWLEMYSLAQAHKSGPLLHAIIQVLSRDFETVAEKEDFQQLDSSTLIALISSSHLAVASELKVYQAVRRWVQFQPSTRGPLLGVLMRHVRLPLLTPGEQAEFQRDLEVWGDLDLQWKEMKGEERLQRSGGLRQGMCKPHILSIDTQMWGQQPPETDEPHMGCYDPQTEMWEKLPGLRLLSHACCTADGDTVYLSGGVYKNAYSTAAYEFSSFKGYWVQLPSMAVPRIAHAFLFCNRKLFAIGGWQKFQTFLGSGESFDLSTETWSNIPKLPFALSHPASSVFRSKIYLCGGATGISAQWLFHRGLLIYETSSTTWSQVPLSTGFFAAGAVPVENGIYVIGGYAEKKTREWVEGTLAPENRHSTRRCFFVNETGRISHNSGIPKLPQGIANAGVISCGKRIYVLGGEDLNQCYKTIYYWEPGEPRWHRSLTEIPVSREGISRFACTALQRPIPHILQLFQQPSLVPVAAVSRK